MCYIHAITPVYNCTCAWWLWSMMNEDAISTINI